MAAGKKFNFLKAKTCLIFLGIVLILGSFQLGFMGKLFTICTQPDTLPDLYEDERKLEPAENISSYEITYQKYKCSCPSKQNQLTVFNLKEYLNAGDREFALDRRKKEYEHYLKREPSENILIAPPNSPLGYPIHGVQVMPLNTINLPGLRINAKLPTYTVTLEASLGTINFLVNISDTSKCQIRGKGEKLLNIFTNNLPELNLILKSITYTSTLYSIDSLDIVKFTLGEHIAQIPISIRQPPIPRLHDPGQERKISDLVTITTKTFLRYNKLRTMLQSIRQYYPDMKVIVADDNETPEKIDDPNVEQYIMPYAK
ncbi:4 N-acetylgalactosaminyltransferase 2, partial [Pristimantis euphronides]